MDYKDLFINFAKMALSAILTFVLCNWIGNAFNQIELPKYFFEAIKIIFVTLICAISYLLLNLSFKMNYAQELLKRLKR